MTDSPSTVTVRPARPDDAKAILALIRALADFENLVPPDAGAQRRLIADAFGAKARFEVFLADVAPGISVGYTFVFETYSSFEARPTLYLEDLFVLPEYRQQQVGHALFQFCAAEALRRGCGRLEWTVLDWNVNAIKFYQRHGGRHMSEWLHYRMTVDDMNRLLDG